MKCVSCGHCCKTMSPINHGYCPLLKVDGDIYTCSDYENRPNECRNHTYPAKVCPVGISTLSLISDALIEKRLGDIRKILDNPILPF